MNVFSKENLSKLISAARKNWFLFVPVLLVLAIGYFVLAIFDWFYILYLKIRNVFLNIGFTIKNKANATTKKMAQAKIEKQLLAKNNADKRLKLRQDKNVIKAEKTQAHKANYAQIQTNAVIARTQLLAQAVTYCEQKAKLRDDKKQELKNVAVALKSSNKGLI